MIDLLNRAETNRSVRFKALSTAARQLRPLEEILTYTKEFEKYFRSDEYVSRVAFRLRRGDFATAIEALLSGFHKTVLDSMRDVIEIEFLLRDFVLHHTHIDEWLNGLGEAPPRQVSSWLSAVTLRSIDGPSPARYARSC